MSAVLVSILEPNFELASAAILTIFPHVLGVGDADRRRTGLTAPGTGRQGSSQVPPRNADSCSNNGRGIVIPAVAVRRRAM